MEGRLLIAAGCPGERKQCGLHCLSTEELFPDSEQSYEEF